MRQLLVTLVSVLGLVSGARAQACPITGLSTSEVGVGTGGRLDLQPAGRHRHPHLL